MPPTSPLVLLHGLIGTLQAPDLQPFFPSRPLFAPDLLGYGAWRDCAPADIRIATQVAHLHTLIDQQFGAEPVDLLGHSVGGVVAVAFAQRYPQRVARLVSVEGNFTLRDAFWSSSVARMPLAEVEAMLAGFRADPLGWLAAAGVEEGDGRLAVAQRWLDQQPASTVKAMAQSVVEVTARADYSGLLRRVFASHPVHLLAGARSHAGWDVPAWARHAAASDTQVDGSGHLLMLEQPQAFARAVNTALSG